MSISKVIVKKVYSALCSDAFYRVDWSSFPLDFVISLILHQDLKKKWNPELKILVKRWYPVRLLTKKVTSYAKIESEV